MFDIQIHCKCKNFIDCDCKVKDPIRERYFLVDQRTVRKMAIGNVDLKVTQLLYNNMKRKAIQSSRLENSGNVSEELFGIKTSDTNTSSESYYTCTSEKRFKLCNLALACDRIGVSDQSGSLLVNAVLKDFLVTKENPSRIVDQSKIRERKNRRLQLQECARNDHFEVQGVFFDGKKDVTFHQDKKRDKVLPKISYRVAYCSSF